MRFTFYACWGLLRLSFRLLTIGGGKPLLALLAVGAVVAAVGIPLTALLGHQQPAAAAEVNAAPTMTSAPTPGWRVEDFSPAHYPAIAVPQPAAQPQAPARRQAAQSAAPAAQPTSSPPVTAICQDGSVSHSLGRSGTCSHHGGVKSWKGLRPRNL